MVLPLVPPRIKSVKLPVELIPKVPAILSDPAPAPPAIANPGPYLTFPDFEPPTPGCQSRGELQLVRLPLFHFLGPIEPLLRILAENEEPRRRQCRLQQRRTAVGLTAFRFDQSQEVGRVRVSSATIEHGLQNFLGALELLEAVINNAERLQSIGGIGVLPHAQFGQRQRPLPLGSL